jgi:iron-sulfur cluster repair protein YtfE (RIC family)
MTEHSESRDMLEEHKEIRRELEELDNFLEKAPAQPGRQKWLMDLRDRLGRLRPTLEGHFAREEAVGFFEQIEAAWPNAAPQCQQFREEHRRLVVRIDDVLSHSARKPLSDQPFLTVVTETKSITRDLRDHEGRETDLFNAAIEGGPAAQD